MPTYQVVHNTQYYFDEPVFGLTLLTCLKPTQNMTQTLGFHKVICLPNAKSNVEKIDAFGNVQQQLTFHRPLQKIEVSAISDVMINGLREQTISKLQPPLWNELFTSSELQNILVAAKKFGADIFTKKNSLSDKLVALMYRVFTSFVYDVSATDVNTPLLSLFQFRRGVCQDFARVCIAVLQAHNIAARYVSGYLYCDPCEKNLVRQSASHAWVSVFLPDVGWRDFDPTNNQWADENYITLAWGRDYVDVIPVQGQLNGAQKQRIKVSVIIEKQA